MKLKIILSVLLLFSLLKVDANPLVDISIASGKEEVFLHSNDIPFEILKFVREVRAGDYESFFRRLQSFFSDIPYELARELELHCQNGYKIFVSHILINAT